MIETCNVTEGAKVTGAKGTEVEVVVGVMIGAVVDDVGVVVGVMVGTVVGDIGVVVDVVREVALLLLIRIFSKFDNISLSYTMIYLYPSLFECFDIRCLKLPTLIILFKTEQKDLVLK